MRKQDLTACFFFVNLFLRVFFVFGFKKCFDVILG
jgi:hypothetical protein